MALPFSRKHSMSLGSSAALFASAMALASMYFCPMRLSKASIALAATVANSAATAYPFTLETLHFSFNNDPKGELSRGEIKARRCDGTTVMVQTMRGGKPVKHEIRVIMYLDGRRLLLNDALAAKTSWPARSTNPANGMREQLLQPPTNCVKAKWEIFLRHDTVLGHKMDVVNVSFGTTAWKAPDLGCEMVQYRMGYKHEGVFKLTEETRAKSLKLGEPDPRLFDEGAGYTEMRPSEMLRRVTANEGLPWDQHLEEEAARDDKLYLAGH